MTLHDTHYRHWQGRHLGIWRRRAAIAANGLTGCFQIRWLRHLVTLCWGGCLLQVTVLFFLSQLMIPDSIVVEWLGHLNPALQALGNGLATWLARHPDISVPTTYDLVCYYFASNLQTLTFIAIAIAIPQLITRDLSSNAIIIYSSKAVGRFDYFLGKFATIFGLMALTWLGPMCVAWFGGNLLSTQWYFFWHSRAALGHTLLFVLGAMALLSVLAMGISAISPRVKTTVSAWVALWLLGNALVPIAQQTRPWLKFFSLTHDLREISRSIFEIRTNLQVAQENFPTIGTMLRGRRGPPSDLFQVPEVTGAFWGLGVMAALALFILWRRVKAE